MAIDASFLDTLRSRLAISDVVGRRVRLINAGREKKACCPFHKEKTPSFTVNDHKGFFHCFGCGAHGDIIAFVMRAENRDFVETVELLAAEAGLTVPQSDPAERARARRNRDLYQLVEAAAAWFERQLFEPEGRTALDYLTNRGLSGAAIARFRLGYAPTDRRGLARHLGAAGFAEADMVEAGLLKRPDDGRQPYGFFRHRVMFPVTDRRGRVVAFGARKLDGDGPKYINSAETPLFHKGQLLYGLSRARQAAADGAVPIVTEGYMDVISLVEGGFPAAVAPLGTALGEDQILTLWRLLPGGEGAPILCFDGDTAGRRAAWRAIERTLPHLAPGRSIRLAFLPEGEDPDSLIRRHGARAVQEVLDAAVPLDQAVWTMLLAGRAVGTPEEKAALRRDLDQMARQIADRDVQALYRRDLLRRFDETFIRPRPPRSGPAGPGYGPASRGYGYSGGGAGPGYGRSGTGPGSAAPPWADRFASFRAETRRQARRRPDVRGVRARIILATLLNHPELQEEFADTLLAQPMPDELDALRLALLARIAETAAGTDDSDTAGDTADGADAGTAETRAGTEPAALHAALRGAGHGATLDALLCPNVYDHAGFARPDADPAAGRAGLLELISFSEEVGLRQDRTLATEKAKSELTEHNLRRMTLLSQEMLTKIRGIDDAS